MDGVWVAAGAAVLSSIGMIFNVIITVTGNRSTSREIANLQSRHAESLEQAKQRHQLSLAALDRRLQVHQEAYALWRKFSTAAHDKNDMDCLATECEDWWLKNCLYLSTEAREAFFVAWQAASHHKEFVDIGDLALIDKNNKKIADAVIPILKGVALPSLDGSQLEADGKGKTVNS